MNRLDPAQIIIAFCGGVLLSLGVYMAKNASDAPSTSAPAAIAVTVCESGDGTMRPCAMHTSRCTFIVSADDRHEPLASATYCRDGVYSDPCRGEWQGFRDALARDSRLGIRCGR